jgi:hypothetical protein
VKRLRVGERERKRWRERGEKEERKGRERGERGEEMESRIKARERERDGEYERESGRERESMRERDNVKLVLINALCTIKNNSLLQFFIFFLQKLLFFLPGIFDFSKLGPESI